LNGGERHGFPCAPIQRVEQETVRAAQRHAARIVKRKTRRVLLGSQTSLGVGSQSESRWRATSWLAGRRPDATAGSAQNKTFCLKNWDPYSRGNLKALESQGLRKHTMHTAPAKVEILRGRRTFARASVMENGL
jgi:hypothetical protein